MIQQKLRKVGNSYVVTTPREEDHSIRYLSVADVLALHQAILERTGVTPAPLRDEGVLASAVMRPQMAAYYEGADLLRQSALLAIGISQAQAFLDRKKLTAWKL